MCFIYCLCQYLSSDEVKSISSPKMPQVGVEMEAAHYRKGTAFGPSALISGGRIHRWLLLCESHVSPMSGEPTCFHWLENFSESSQQKGWDPTEPVVEAVSSVCCL